MEYTYLMINFGTIIIPFIFSFHPRLKFYQTWNAFFPAVLITGFLFIIWDVWFTHLGVWGFNPDYLTGIKVFNLPLEEVLFFFCIPYACVFTFHCMSIFMEDPFSEKTIAAISIVLVVFLLISAVVHYPKLYTASTFLSLSALLALCQFTFNIPWLGRFYIVYGILLLPFFIVNGLLTGTGLDQPVVWYNEAEIIGIRLLTIPIEDIFYGMELILLNLLIYQAILKNKPQVKNSGERIDVTLNV